MGLDMYLCKETYVKNWDHMKPDQRHVISITKAGLPTAIKTERIKTVTEEIGYWRKANQIHAWFIANCAGDVDDCSPVRVERAQLEELLTACEVVLARPTDAGPELLPTQEGFFFGSTEYGDDYLEDIRQTVEILKEALEDPDADEFIYRASW